MLQPKKEKHRKVFRGRSSFQGKTKGGGLLTFGSYGLKSLDSVEITARQIESARKAINNYLKRQGKLWIRIFPHKPVTKKASEVPMGSGKGSVELHVALVNVGRILFELEGITEEQARNAFNKAVYKLPCKTKFITKELI